MTAFFVYGLFLVTGFAGLIYEVVWLRMLVRVFGSTALATGNVLAVFMGGLALGAWLAGRRAKKLKSPLAAYGAVECASAVAAAAATVFLPRLPELLAAALPSGDIGAPAVVAFRSLSSAAVLLPPTMLMGMSFPLLAEFFSRRKDASGFAGRTAVLYGANTLGAVLGALASGYVLLGLRGERGTASIAVALNLAVGVAAWLASRISPPEAAAPAAAPAEAPPRKKKREAAAPASTPLAGRMGLLMALSGFGALGMEVLWTRLLVLLLGNSIYAFSAMLAATLLGIGVGSILCSRRLKASANLPAAFIVLQILAAGAILLSSELYLAQGLARLDGSYLYSPIRGAADFYRLLATGSGIILPVSLIYGALFPLAIAVVEPSGAGEAAGKIYALNTVGAVLGSLACGLVLIPVLGTHGALYALAALHLGIAALAAFWSGVDAWVALEISFGVLLAASFLRPDPFFSILKARLEKRGVGELDFHLEGASSTVTVYSRGGEHLILINGIIVSGKGDLGRMMAHFPLILQAAPKRALVICLGAGNTFRAAVDHGVEVDLAELEPEVVAAFSRLWPDDAASYLANPRAHVHVNDGRNFLLSSSASYDLIVVDGTPPIFSAGTVNLYSQEFTKLARKHLTKTGILALWVPLPCFERDFWMIARNFTDSFGHTMAWAQPNLQGILLLGSDSPLDLAPKLLTRRARERGLLQKNPWLNGGLLDPKRLVSDAALRAGAAASANVTDDRPYTEFPLPVFAAGTPLRAVPDFLPFTAK